MKLFGGLIRYFRRSRAEKMRRKELELRMKLSEARREADTLRRGAENARKDAVRLEAAGKHNEAVSKALEAKNKDALYATARKNVEQCELVYEQAKAHKATMESIRIGTQLAQAVIGEVDMEEAENLTAEMQAMNEQLTHTQEALTAFQEGFASGDDNTLRDLAGEEALADLMAAAAPAKKTEAPAAEPVKSAETPAPAEKAEGGEDQQEWLNAQRRKLAELA